MEYIYVYDSPLGEMLFKSDGERLTGVWFGGQKYFPERCSTEGKEAVLPIFKETAKWFDIYFGGEIPCFTPPLAINTTAFRKEVWAILSEIPYGETRTYGEIAAIIAKKRGVRYISPQAVGGAVGHNAFAVIIPCHRVVGANGDLTGYAAGLGKKIALLKTEKADLTRFKIIE